MRLTLLLPQVEPSVFREPSVCLYAKCGGKQFHLRQEVRKPVHDTVGSANLRPKPTLKLIPR
jgi:hypothetical protein